MTHFGCWSTEVIRRSGCHAPHIPLVQWQNGSILDIGHYAHWIKSNERFPYGKTKIVTATDRYWNFDTNFTQLDTSDWEIFHNHDQTFNISPCSKTKTTEIWNEIQENSISKAQARHSPSQITLKLFRFSKEKCISDNRIYRGISKNLFNASACMLLVHLMKVCKTLWCDCDCDDDDAVVGLWDYHESYRFGCVKRCFFSSARFVGRLIFFV